RIRMAKTEQPRVRTGQADFPLGREEFNRRFRARFSDPAFMGKEKLIDELMDTAWDGYLSARKSPVKQNGGSEFSDPDFEHSVDWLATRKAVHEAQQRHDES